MPQRDRRMYGDLAAGGDLPSVIEKREKGTAPFFLKKKSRKGKGDSALFPKEKEPREKGRCPLFNYYE